MNILFVSDVSIESVIGGAERVLHETTTRLMARGHHVSILTRLQEGQKKHTYIDKNISEYRYSVDWRSPFRFLFSTLRNGKRLFESLPNQNAFDCINFHQPFSAFPVCFSRNSKKIKKIYTCHSLSFEEFISRNPHTSGWLDSFFQVMDIAFRKWIERYVMNQSDQIVVLSRYTYKKLQKQYAIPGKKIILIPGGVDTDKFYPTEKKDQYRERLDIPNNKLILFTVRNLVYRMGLENLIKALSIVKLKIRDVLLIIGGDGPLKAFLINMTKQFGLEEMIRFVGFISEKDLPDYYRAADLFVLPTKELEGFGLVTLEAMASGIPVLGTPVGGTKEIIGQFDPSFLFKGTRSEDMADLILEKCHFIKNNPNAQRELSRRCRDFVAKNYSWNKNIDALEEIFGDATRDRESFQFR